MCIGKVELRVETKWFFHFAKMRNFKTFFKVDENSIFAKTVKCFIIFEENIFSW